MQKSERDKQDEFLRLYVEHEESLRGFARSLVMTLEDAREVMQNAAVVLWRKFEQLDTPANFRRWAFGVVRFEALAFRRDRARDRHVFSDELIAMLEVEAEEAAEDAGLERRALDLCLARLPDKQSALVKAAYARGARIDEMARSTGRTPMSLYKALHRIRMALADCIRQQLRREEHLA